MNTSNNLQEMSLIISAEEGQL